ncbi:DNA cytosine methyltransferase [soil metagenome]
MKHPNLLDGLFPHEVARIQRVNIGGKVGVGFAGGGGSSIGLKAAGLTIDFAMNHDAAAIAMHAANCPEALHYCQDIWQVPPGDPCPGEPIRFMWFSPDCKHFSKAKGAAPVEKKIRDLAWVIVLWARLRRPDVIAIENVEEFRTWGPLILVNGKLVPDPKRKGEYFRRFNREMAKHGYIGEWRELRACNYGTPTSRLRLFGQFRCDGHPIKWPEPTHGAPTDPDVISGRKLPWRTAADIMEWDEPCHSVFLTREEARRAGVNRPLVDNTMARITLGLQRYVLEAARAYIVPITHSGPARVHSIDEPTRTVTCANRGELALAVPSMIQRGWGERAGQQPRALDIDSPIGTQVAGGVKHAIVANYIASAGGSEYAGRPRSVEHPLNTVMTDNRQSMVAAHLTKFRKGSAGADIEDPTPTITANSYQVRPGGAAPIGLVEAFISTQFGNSIGSSAEDPLGTQLATVKHAAIAAHMIQNNGGEVGHPMDKPLSTICTKVGHHAVAASHLAHLRGSGPRSGHPIDEPAPTLTAGRGHHLGEARAFLVKYFSSAEHGQSVSEPLHTVTTKPRFALVEVYIAETGLTDDQRYTAWWVARMIDVFGHPDGIPKRSRPRKGVGSLRHRSLLEVLDRQHRQRPSAVGRDGWIVWDIGMRMLTVRERYRAQGVADDFIINVDVDGKAITATKQGEMCGNMVCPQMSEAIARAALPELTPMEIAA